MRFTTTKASPLIRTTPITALKSFLRMARIPYLATPGHGGMKAGFNMYLNATIRLGMPNPRDASM